MIGGELSYVCLGGDQYEINLVVYIDCGPLAEAGFDDPAFITIYDANSFIVQQLQLFEPDIEPLEPNVEGLCLNTVPNVCVERGYI